jgi:hypothetical protein
MSILNSLIVIAGILTMEGKALPSQEVLLIQTEPLKIVGATKTDEHGNFSLQPPSKHGNFHVVAKVRHEGIATVMHQELKEGELRTKIQFHLRKADLIPVHCSVLMPEHTPPALDVFADLQLVDGVPQALQPYFRHASAGVAYSYYYRYSTAKTEFTWWVRPGKIRIGADFLPEDGLRAGGAPQGFAVTRIERLPNCEPLPGTSLLGFELDVYQETRLQLRLEAVQR